MRKLIIRKEQYPGLELQMGDFFIIKGKLGEKKLIYKGGKESEKWFVFGSKKVVRSFGSFLTEACEGVSYGFAKKMYLHGIGYRVWTNRKQLLFQIGYNHLIKFSLPETMSAFAKKNRFVLFGLGKREVNQIAQRLVWLKVPDSYKGKGVRYEHVFFFLKKSKDAKKS